MTSDSDEVSRPRPKVVPVEPRETRVAEESDELPVVARMVVEIRSDGTRTIARGAVEDRLADERVALEFRAGSPWELAKSLAKMLMDTPSFAKQAARAMLPAVRRRRKGA